MWFFQASRRLSELEEELRKLRRQVEEKDLDWVEMRARCKRLLDRTQKASERLDTPAETPTTQPNGEDPATLRRSMGRLLTARQLEVQQEILRKRAGG